MSTPYEQHPERFLKLHSSIFPNILVRLVIKGDHYGKGGLLTHDGDMPLVEFFDNDFDHEPWLGIRAQFVSRYYISTLLESDPYRGLCLDGGVPKWTLSAEEMREVRSWLVARILAELQDCWRKER